MTRICTAICSNSKSRRSQSVGGIFGIRFLLQGAMAMVPGLVRKDYLRDFRALWPHPNAPVTTGICLLAVFLLGVVHG